MKENKISSNWTKPMLVLMILLWVICTPILIFFASGDLKFEPNQVLAIIISLLLVGLALYLTFSLAEVRLTEDEIKFKKIFGSEKSYSFDKIGYPSSFRYKRLKFTSVEMKGKNGSTINYLILNNNALLSGERKDAEKILWMLKKKA